MDRRSLKFNGKVAHLSLRGQVEAERFTDGQVKSVIRSTATLWDAPAGRRDRELLLGDQFCVLDKADGYAFGFALRDQYVGYVEEDALHDFSHAATHKVGARLTYALREPDFKTQTEHMPLSFGSTVRVIQQDERWARIELPECQAFVPAAHLKLIKEVASDPVQVAELFLGAPYVWGGNSSLGLDCSGLVQAGCLACGLPCPGDSDQQQVLLGYALDKDASYERGDLLFWKGHVAWVSDPDTLLHANAFHMAVAFEPIHDAINRIEAQGDGPVTAHKRLGTHHE